MIKYIIIVIILILAFDYLLTCNYSNQNENFEDIPVLDNYKSTDVTVRLLKEVKTILESKDINYWIHTEALLGAVNYKKIHPWGDNIDLCILDTDEDKLLTIKKILNDKNLGIIEFFAGYRIYELNGKELSKVNYLYPFITILLFTESNNKITIKYK